MTETGRQIRIKQHRLTIYADSQHLITALAGQIHGMVTQQRAQQQRFFMSLAGGTTPKALYTHLAKDRSFTASDWQQFEIFFGDERYVPHDSADSNFNMAREAWLNYVPIPKSQVHPIPTDCADADSCASQYAITLASVPKRNDIPRFDLILLGMGDDGHTASLFPDTPVLQEQQKWVAGVYVAKFNSQRITLTYPVLNNASKVIVLVTGESKAVTIKRVMHDAAAHFPIQQLNNPEGVDWYLDEAAAAELS